MQGNDAQDLVWDRLGKEPKSGKGRDLTGSGSNKWRKEENGGKRG